MRHARRCPCVYCRPQPDGWTSVLTGYPRRRRLTGAQVLAVAGIIAAAVTFVGGSLLDDARIAGVGGLVMLLGNVGALLAERRRK